ncbi:conjugative transfer protein MobI(A/C) [Pseudovibrio sp. Ad37]|uniref:conjugative transfer protein MobI(A/C) n=1 Tax=Pseudovibrio sp. Ad37 TaxID=989422 RepID=UPI0007AE426A|nr:conjugative transfer protein MobI(A/C) [Pseudovibrio sp. Ad37]KZL24221.1 hypothetical protein PsAD37_02792 [Pseudovibrio sp. Ad37]
MEYTLDELGSNKGADVEDARLKFLLDDRANAGARQAEILAWLDAELRAILIEGQAEADWFWKTHAAARKEKDAELATFGTRVRLVQKTTFSAEWFKNRYMKVAGGSTRVFSTYMSKPKGFKHNMNSFRAALDWELDLIEIIEPRYALLRERAAALTTIRKTVKAIEKCRTSSTRRIEK